MNEDDAFWRDVLLDEGVAEDDIARAEREGPLELFALERFILTDSPRYDVDQAAERSGIPAESLASFWRALGFPDPRPGEPTFLQGDLDLMRTVLDSIGAGILNEAVALQMARVIGSSLARIATAQVEASALRQGGLSLGPEQLGNLQDPHEVKQSVELIPMLSALMDMVWRRHLAVEARRRILNADDTREREITVGFADLEGFTALSQQLPTHELAEVVDHFEHVAYEVVSQAHGRVVKMIGDEVMFTTADVRSGADLALRLAEAYGADEALADVRVGLATGQGLALEGDLYGPAVNLASRIVSIAYPGTVVVPSSVREALADDPDFEFRPLRPHYLRNIGRARLWVMRRTGEEDEEGTLSRARDHRATRRAWIADRMAERLADTAAEAAGDTTERFVRLLIEGRPTVPGGEPGPDGPEPDDTAAEVAEDPADERGDTT